MLAGLICDLLWSDPDKDTQTWNENDRGVSSANEAPRRSRAQVVEDGYEFFAKRQLVTIFTAPNYCGVRPVVGVCVCLCLSLSLS